MICSTFQLTTRAPGADSTEVIHQAIESTVASEGLGYANVWLAEHHGTLQYSKAENRISAY